MASLIGAVAHDLDHPGVNQHFLISTSNHLAILYDVRLFLLSDYAVLVFCLDLNHRFPKWAVPLSNGLNYNDNSSDFYNIFGHFHFIW